MQKTQLTATVLTLVLAGALAGCVGLAPQPGYGYQSGPPGPGSAPPPAYDDHFTARQRAFAHRYYGHGRGHEYENENEDEHGHGHGHGHGYGNCPPGLAKKHNGCMPPGQAKKWAIGQRLPGDVTTYPIPRPVYQGLGAPPPGYRYVRVLNDILLISTSTQTVVDAIRDLGNQ